MSTGGDFPSPRLLLATHTYSPEKLSICQLTYVDDIVNADDDDIVDADDDDINCTCILPGDVLQD